MAICALATTAFADTPKGVVRTAPLVELYTSQNCALCPKANAEFAAFAETEDVIALSFPVSYWDYLGWTDSFARDEFDDRQKSANRTMGRRGPYTPQVVMNGANHCSGARPKKMNKTLAKMRKKANDLKIVLGYDGEKAVLKTIGEPLGETFQAEVNLVHYVPGSYHRDARNRL